MSNVGEVYDEDYFMRGITSGKSLYTAYSWKPELTIPMCQRIIDHCGIEKGSRVLDFGCARGYSVRALRGLGYDAYGVDISKWALENADPEAKPYLDIVVPNTFAPLSGMYFNWIIAKDVLEHVPYVDFVINNLMEHAINGLFVVVPLSQFRNGKYVVADYEKDVTHTQRLRLIDWAEMFVRPGWAVECSYRVKGVKDNYSQYKYGNGFLTVRRIEE